MRYFITLPRFTHPYFLLFTSFSTLNQVDIYAVTIFEYPLFLKVLNISSIPTWYYHSPYLIVTIFSYFIFRFGHINDLFSAASGWIGCDNNFIKVSFISRLFISFQLSFWLLLSILRRRRVFGSPLIFRPLGCYWTGYRLDTFRLI
jgi:hypothetical protein